MATSFGFLTIGSKPRSVFVDTWTKPLAFKVTKVPAREMSFVAFKMVKAMFDTMPERSSRSWACDSESYC